MIETIGSVCRLGVIAGAASGASYLGAHIVHPILFGASANPVMAATLVGVNVAGQLLCSKLDDDTRNFWRVVALGFSCYAAQTVSGTAMSLKEVARMHISAIGGAGYAVYAGVNYAASYVAANFWTIATVVYQLALPILIFAAAFGVIFCVLPLCLRRQNSRGGGGGGGGGGGPPSGGGGGGFLGSADASALYADPLTRHWMSHGSRRPLSAIVHGVPAAAAAAASATATTSTLVGPYTAAQSAWATSGWPSSAYKSSAAKSSAAGAFVSTHQPTALNHSQTSSTSSAVAASASAVLTHGATLATDGSTSSSSSTTTAAAASAASAAAAAADTSTSTSTTSDTADDSVATHVPGGPEVPNDAPLPPTGLTGLASLTNGLRPEIIPPAIASQLNASTSTQSTSTATE